MFTINCIQASHSCPVWNLNQCIQLHPDANVETSECNEGENFCDDTKDCCKIVKACIMKGDSVKLNTCIHADISVPSIVYFYGTLSNVSLSSDSNGSITFSNDENVVSAPILLVPYNNTVIFTGYADLSIFNNSSVNVEITIEPNLSASTNMDISNITCGCGNDNINIESSISIGKEEKESEEFTINPEDAPFSFEHPFDVTVEDEQLIINMKSKISDPSSQEDSGNTICPIEDNAIITLNPIVPTVKGEAFINTSKSSDWCVCKSGDICSGDKDAACVRSPGYFTTHGPNFGNCANCHRGNNQNEWPENLSILVGQQELTNEQLCLLLRINPNTQANDDCITGCDSLTNDAVVLLKLMRFYITVRMNLSRGTVLCPALNEYLDPVTELLENEIPNLFIDETLTLNPDICTLDIEDSQVDLLKEAQDVFDSYVNGRLEGCPEAIHCNDNNQQKQKQKQKQKETEEHCDCPFPMAAYTLMLSKNTTVNTKNRVKITVILPEGCPLSYAKVFEMSLFYENGDPVPNSSRTVAFVPDGETVRSVVLENLQLIPDSKLVAKLQWTHDTFDLTTGQITEGETTEFIMSHPIDVTEKCVNTTTSILTDVTNTSSDNCDYEGVFPSCNSTDSCDKFVIDNTSISFEYNNGESPPPFVLCNNGRSTTYRSTLEDIIKSIIRGEEIDLDMAFDDLLGLDPSLPNSCTNTPYDAIEIKYVLRLDPCVCTIENVAKVINEQHNSKTISTSEVKLENSRCKPEETFKQKSQFKQIVIPQKTSKMEKISSKRTILSSKRKQVVKPMNPSTKGCTSCAEKNKNKK